MRRPRSTGGAPAADDEQLIARIASGNPDALGDLYDRYCDRAYRVARAICRDVGRAEDAVQEAFLSIWKSSATYQPQRGSVAAWVLALVRHRAIDVARSHRVVAAHRAGGEWVDERRAPDGDVADRVVAVDDAAHLHGMLDRLPHAQREVIALAFYGELSHTEIAGQLGIPTGTVKGRMRLGLEKLRAEIA